MVPVESSKLESRRASIGPKTGRDLLTPVGLLRLSIDGLLDKCRRKLPRPWRSGGVARALVGLLAHFSHKCMHVLGWVRKCGRQWQGSCRRDALCYHVLSGSFTWVGNRPDWIRKTLDEVNVSEIMESITSRLEVEDICSLGSYDCRRDADTYF